MSPIQRFLDRCFLGMKVAALAAILVVPVFAQDAPSDITNNILDNTAEKNNSVDDIVAIPQNDSAVVSQDSVALNLKSVLYLGGGYQSAWFQLGVLYAIEEYGIPVDSIVGTSWGAWIGSLWARGVPVDEIQRIMLDPALVNYVGKDLTQDEMREKTGKEMDVSLDGIPSIRQRFTLQVDSAGHVKKVLHPLEMDSSYIRKKLARLRFQESLYRQDEKFQIPFAVQDCEGLLAENSPAAVVGKLPLWKTSNCEKVSGELCPHYAVPAEDRLDELSLMVVAEPLRGEVKGDDRYRILVKQASERLANQPGVLIRAHLVQDTSRSAWIQAGFSALENQLAKIKFQLNRKVDYSMRTRTAALPWFKFTPSFEGVSAEIQSSIQSYWEEADTGLVAPANLALNLSKNPAYDSLDFEMLSNGDLWVGAAVHPTFDISVGGFGSNIIGPNAYFEGTVNFVNQMEICFVLKGFWGSSSFGFMPRLDVSRLWNRHWSVHLGYDYLKLRPLKSYNNDVNRFQRIESEERNDFTMSLVYQIDERQRAFVDFLFGHRVFELDSALFGKKPIKTYPVSPMLYYSYVKGEDSPWFGNEGLKLNVGVGMESIGFDFGINDVIPIYWKIVGDVRYTHSPRNSVTFSVGAAGGIERYHEDGYGYVVPASFGYEPLDVAFRLHGKATPWLTEWYNAELSSHEYALLRASGSIHNRYLGLWLFGAFFHDFEKNPYAVLSENKFVLEPAILFTYKSLKIYMGMNRIVDQESLKNLKRFKDYTYFVRIGEYNF